MGFMRGGEWVDDDSQQDWRRNYDQSVALSKTMAFPTTPEGWAQAGQNSLMRTAIMKKLGYEEPSFTIDDYYEAITKTPQYQAMSAHQQAAAHESLNQIESAIDQSNKGGLLGDLGLPKFSLNPIQQAKNIYRNDQQNVGKVIEAAAPVVNAAIKNNPAQFVARTDKQAADGLGWNWLSHMTGKTQQTFDRTTDKLAGFQNLFERRTAEGMQQDKTYTPSDANATRLEADRAHVRTNSANDIQQGIQRGDYTVQPNGDVVDRYGASVLGKGLAQRGATALGAASIVFPWLAPFAAMANTATAYRNGAPAGKSIAQGIGGYYAGQLGGGFGESAGGALGGATGAYIGRAAGQGAGRGLATGYASGLRGGDLLQAGAVGGLAGGLGQWAGGQFENPILSGMARGATSGAINGYQRGDVGQGMQQGLISGGLSGAGGLLAQQTGFSGARQLPAYAYMQYMRNKRG